MSEAKVWPVDRSLLIVDDDAPLRMRLARAMETRGFTVSAAENVAEGVELAMENPPAYAVIDLRLDDGNGFEVVQAIQEAKPDCRIVMLTGYGNIATAVAAIRERRLLAKTRQRRRYRRLLIGNAAAIARSTQGSDVGRLGALGTHPAGV